MAEKINIASIDIDVNEFIRSAAAAKDELKRLTDANKSLKNATGDNTQAIVQNEIEIKKQRSEYNNSIKAAQNLQTATNELSKAIDTEGKSVQQVIIDRNKLIGLSKNIKGNSEEEIALRKKLNGAIDDQTKFIRENSSEYSASKDMIGEYKQALNALSPTLGKIFDVVSQLKDGFVKQKEIIEDNIKITKAKIAADKAQAASQGIVKNSIISVNGALKLFKLVLISTGVGAFVIVLGSLITYLTTTQDGIDAVNSVLRPLKEILATTLGLVQKFGAAIVDTFKGKSNFISDFGNAVKKNLIDRFSALSKIIIGVFTLNKEMVKEGIADSKKAGEEFQKVQKENLDAIKNTYKTALERGKRIAALDIEISKGKNQLILDEAKLKNEIKKGNQLAENAALSAKEREEGAIASIAASKKLLELQQNLNNKEIERAELSAEANDTDRETQGEINALKAKANDLETAQLELITTQTTKLNSIRKAAATSNTKIADDTFQKSQQQMSEELELFLAMQGTKAKTLSEEVAIAQRVADKKTKILDAQLAAGKISQTKYNTELLLIDQELQSKKDEQKDLELKSLADFEQKKKELKDEIAIANAESETAAAELKAGQDFEKQLLELENMQLNEEQKTELLALLTEQREQVLQDIRDSFTEAQIEKIKEANQEIIKSESETAKAREDIANVLTGALIGLLGDSLGAKLASIAIEAAIQSGLVAIEGAAASGKIGANIAAANAAAIAASPLTGGLPFTAINTAQGATLQAGVKVSTKKAIGKILGASALKALGTLATSKKAKGGILEGPSHAMGGILTPFGELEGSEAVINKNSTSRFKPLLSAINVAGGGVSFGATGSTQNELINYDAMARAFGNAISAMPAPQVAVTEINEVSKNYTKVLERANI